MTLRSSQVLDEYQRPVPGATIYVYDNALGTQASLTSDGSSPLAQPVRTDEFGIYTYHAVDNYYREDTYYAGKLRYREIVAIGNGGTPGADLTLRSDLAATNGWQLVGGALSSLVKSADFPAFAGAEPNASIRVYARNTGSGGVGRAGLYSFMVNGTGVAPFSTIGGTDCVPLSAVVFSGADAPYSVCTGNIVSRYAGLPGGINWGLEVDMNNECSASYTEGDPRGGQGIVVNTGSTYSPDTGIVIQRVAGEGTGPGWKRGITIKGVRNVGISVQAMTSTTAPGMSPAATGTITAFAVNVGGEPENRFIINESGRLDWGSGAAVADVNLSRIGVGALGTSGTFKATQFLVGANAVLGARKTGWAVDTGTAKRTANATYSAGTALTFSAAYVQAEHTAAATRLAAIEAALQDITQTMKALKDDLHATAGHGIIGT